MYYYYCARRRCTTDLGEGEGGGGRRLSFLGTSGPAANLQILILYIYTRTDQYINCHKRAGAACTRWRLYNIILLYCRFAGKAVPPPLYTQSFPPPRFASLHRRRPFRRRGSRTTTMLCTRSRVCACAHTRAGNGGGGATPKLFSREEKELIAFWKTVFISF